MNNRVGRYGSGGLSSSSAKDNVAASSSSSLNISGTQQQQQQQFPYNQYNQSSTKKGRSPSPASSAWGNQQTLKRFANFEEIPSQGTNLNSGTADKRNTRNNPNQITNRSIGANSTTAGGSGFGVQQQSSSRTMITDDGLSPLKGGQSTEFPMNGAATSTSRSGSQARLQDLCAEDKKKIGELIKKLADEKEEKDRLQQQLDAKAKEFEEKLKSAYKDNEIMASAASSFQQNLLDLKQLDASTTSTISFNSQFIGSSPSYQQQQQQQQQPTQSNFQQTSTTTHLEEKENSQNRVNLIQQQQQSNKRPSIPMPPIRPNLFQNKPSVTTTNPVNNEVNAAKQNVDPTRESKDEVDNSDSEDEEDLEVAKRWRELKKSRENSASKTASKSENTCETLASSIQSKPTGLFGIQQPKEQQKQNGLFSSSSLSSFQQPSPQHNSHSRQNEQNRPSLQQPSPNRFLNNQFQQQQQEQTKQQQSSLFQQVKQQPPVTFNQQNQQQFGNPLISQNPFQTQMEQNKNNRVPQSPMLSQNKSLNNVLAEQFSPAESLAESKAENLVDVSNLNADDIKQLNAYLLTKLRNLNGANSNNNNNNSGNNQQHGQDEGEISAFGRRLPTGPSFGNGNVNPNESFSLSSGSNRNWDFQSTRKDTNQQFTQQYKFIDDEEEEENNDKDDHNDFESSNSAGFQYGKNQHQQQVFSQQSVSQQFAQKPPINSVSAKSQSIQIGAGSTKSSAVKQVFNHSSNHASQNKQFTKSQQLREQEIESDDSQVVDQDNEDNEYYSSQFEQSQPTLNDRDTRFKQNLKSSFNLQQQQLQQQQLQQQQLQTNSQRVSRKSQERLWQQQCLEGGENSNQSMSGIPFAQDSPDKDNEMEHVGFDDSRNSSMCSSNSSNQKNFMNPNFLANMKRKEQNESDMSIRIMSGQSTPLVERIRVEPELQQSFPKRKTNAAIGNNSQQQQQQSAAVRNAQSSSKSNIKQEIEQAMEGIDEEEARELMLSLLAQKMNIPIENVVVPQNSKQYQGKSIKNTQNMLVNSQQQQLRTQSDQRTIFNSQNTGNNNMSNNIARDHPMQINQRNGPSSGQNNNNNNSQRNPNQQLAMNRSLQQNQSWNARGVGIEQNTSFNGNEFDMPKNGGGSKKEPRKRTAIDDEEDQMIALLNNTNSNNNYDAYSESIQKVIETLDNEEESFYDKPVVNYQPQRQSKQQYYNPYLDN